MATQNIRLTQPGLKVLRYLLAEVNKQRSGAEISKATKVGSGTLYPMLSRFEDAGWIKGEWEVVEPSEVGRPRRRFYKLTALGRRSAGSALVEMQVPTGQLRWAT